MDFGDHHRFFEGPLGRALEVLSSNGMNGSVKRRLKIDSRFLNKLAYTDEARAYFGVFDRQMKSTGITLGKPDDLCALITEDEKFRQGCQWRSISSALPRFGRNARRGTLDVCLDVLRRLFSYSKFYHGSGWRFDGVCDLTSINVSKATPTSDWRAWKFIHQVIEMQNVYFCPYCNAAAIYAYDEMDTTTGFMESSLDHFCPQSRYPYLAISLYNLIPSCHRCNSGAKTSADPIRWTNGKAEFSLTHPYHDDFHSSLRFEYENVTAQLLSGGGAKANAALTVKARDALMFSRAKQSVDDFRLLRVYGESFWKYLVNLPARWGLARTGYFSTQCEFLNRGSPSPKVERYLVGSPLYEDEINSHHLGKLTIDLLEQLESWHAKQHYLIRHVP